MEASTSRGHGSRGSRDDRRDRRPREQPPGSRGRSRSRSPARPRDRSADRSRHRRRSRSASDSSDEGERRRHRHRSRSRSRDRETKEERRLRKEAKRDRRAKRRERREAREGRKHLGDDYGKHGIIGDGDIFTKQAEFHAWLREEKRIDPDHTPEEALQTLFRGFLEDFNLGILPHDKYYDLERWSLRLDAMRMGRDLGDDDASYDPKADERAVAAAHRDERPRAELTLEQLFELRRIERERVAVSKMRQIGQEVPKSMGVRYEMRIVDMPEE